LELRTIVVLDKWRLLEYFVLLFVVRSPISFVSAKSSYLPSLAPSCIFTFVVPLAASDCGRVLLSGSPCAETMFVGHGADRA